jgi:hypothetical protein
MNKFVETQSQIIRVRHSNKFTQIDNDFLRNKSLSMKAKGLLCTILSLPDTWVIKKTTLHQFSSDGIEGTMNAFNELIEADYILVVKTRIKGKFNYKYIVCDIPLRKNHNGLNTTDNTQQINTEEVNTEEVNTLELKTVALATVSIDSLEVYIKSQLKTQ